MIFFLFFSILLTGYFPITIAKNLENIPKDIKFQHYTSENGLSQRSVMSILQDKKGYLWFGTRDGLNKFDGSKFIIYKHNTEDPKSLSNNNIHSIYEDENGNLWVGTKNGLNRYNPKEDNFIQYKQSNSIIDNIIWDIIQIGPNLLWIATDNGIRQINTKTNEIKRIQSQANKKNSISDNKTRYILKSKDGNIWICNTKYIDLYRPSNKTFTRINYPKNKSNNIHLNDLPTLFFDQKNTLWLGYEEGLAKYDTKENTFIDFEFSGRKVIKTGVRSICEDNSGNLWIGTYSGLYILNTTRTDLMHIVHDENDATSLSQNSIYKIIKDARGDIWIGTWANGLNYYNRNNGSFKNISFGNTNNKLNYRVVSGIAEDLNGNLWIGTEGGGLNLYHRKTQKFSYFKNNPSDPNSLSANNVKSVIISKNNKIWIGMHDGGLNFLDPQQTPFKFQKIDFPKEHNISLKGYKVLSLLEDKNGNIWIGTLTGGLIFHDVQKKVLTRIDKDIRTVMSMAQTENPDLLLIGGDKGLETINIYTKKRNKIPIQIPKNGHNNLFINCIFIDKHNNYWAGTEGDGVFMFDPKKKTTKTYGIKDGLPNDIIYGILSDDNENIWLSTNNGISRLDIRSNNIKNYTQSDGLQGNEFNYGSFYKTKAHELFFGGTNGLTYFNPNDIRKNTFVPLIDINKIEVNNTPYSKITDSTLKIVLKHNQNNFSIDFTALSYMQPEKNEFEYILEGNDKSWSYIGTQRRAVYTNIEAGNYVFKVKGSNNDGVWNVEGDSLHIEVLPSPWRTWWAYLIYTAALSAILLYIRRLILLRIKERNEKEKSEEINQLKLNLFTDVSHDFRTPLTLIIGPLEKMINQNSGNNYIKKQHGIMLKNAKLLLELINQILDFRKSESGKLSLQASKNNIVSFVEEIKKSFDALATKKNIQYILDADHENIDVWFDQVKLKNVFFNLLSNAFKFTDDDSIIKINISTLSNSPNSTSSDFVKIAITNFGEVIPERYSNLIFDQFYQLDHTNKDTGYGIGLSLTKRLVDLHKGKISVRSSAEEGTTFTVLLRLGNTHLSLNECIEESSSPQDIHHYDIDPLIDQQQISPILTAQETNNQEFKNLLIVEDNLDLQNFIKEIFINKYNIYLAENGEQAFDIASKNAIDLIISDVSMPIMDGFELCAQIKKSLITSHIPFILLTAKTSTIHQEEGYLIGADAYITKPFNSKILELKVDNLLETRAALIRKFKKDVILEPKNLTITSPDEIFLEKAIHTVEKNITNQEFNASMLVDEMNMSRTVIYTKLKALTGQNLSTFIRIIRLKRAGMLLLQTPMNISEIAYEVGFNDLKYFRECFKDFYKITPSEYKKKQ